MVEALFSVSPSQFEFGLEQRLVLGLRLSFHDQFPAKRNNKQAINNEAGAGAWHGGMAA